MLEETQVQLTVDQRVESLEKINEKLLNTLQGTVKAINDMRLQQEKTQVILNSLLRTIQDQRPLISDQLRESHHLIMSEKVNAIFNSAVKNGFLESVEKIEHNSIVLVQEFDSSGQEIHRAAEFSMQHVEPDYKDLFLGKTVGERIPFVKDGQLQSTFVVQSAFRPSEKIEKQFSEEQTIVSAK